VTKRPVELSTEASTEARAVRDWYRERSERAAIQFVDELERALELLGDNPQLGPRWDHPGLAERVRRLPIRRFPFVLFYTVGESALRVLAVAHTSREPGYWASRLGD